MRIFTIGFTKKPAEDFFCRLCRSGARCIVDVRLNNVSQLAGFAKRDDLAYFLREICGMDYVHRTDLAPTQELLDGYRKGKGGWVAYERQFLDLMKGREIEKHIPQEIIAEGCLLCSEDKPHYCHRRLVAEYLRERWGNVEVVHL
jgi:uncharacterized protein (DUF488 family)